MKPLLPSIVILSLFLVMSCKPSNTKEETKATTQTPIETVQPTTQATASPFSYGIDISKYQGAEINTIDKQKDSLDFVICKATEGITYTDPDFDHNWSTIPKKGYIRGAYHFYLNTDDPKLQAKHFLSVLNNIQAADLPPIVDFEEGSIDKTQSLELIQTNLITFLHSIEEQTNRKPMIYTDVNTGNKYLNDSVFSSYPLWIANYTKNDSPHLPTIWQNQQWLFWQKMDHYKIGNIENDFDVFNGTNDALKSFIKTTNK